MSKVADLSAVRIIRQALTTAQDSLWANLPPGPTLDDTQTISSIRAAVLNEQVASALERLDDPIPVTCLLKTRTIVSDCQKSSRTLIDELWEVLDRPELNRALGQANGRLTWA